MLVIWGSIARSLGRNSRVGQLSTMAAAMALVSISARDWVANTTLAFFLRSVLSHSRSCAPNVGSSRASQPSSTISRVGLPSSRPSIRWNRYRPVEDRDRARRAGEQDRFCQRPVHRRFETRNRLVAHNLRHQISAPPPNEKKDRKKDEAAKAIERPNTIWMRRRKPPPASPKASDRPVTMMMITAIIFVTGPSID